jgi:hypothetical protein
MPIIGNFSSAGKKPTTPTIGTATDGGTGTTASVAFTPSTYIGKSSITYTALSSPGSITGTGSASPITVSGLTTGTAYTFTVKGDTAYGVASDYSAASNSVTPVTPSSYESIATVTLSGTQTTISFTSIPSTYKSLQIRGITKLNGAGYAKILRCQLNSDTGTNYASHFLYGNGTTVTVGGPVGTSFIQVAHAGAMGSSPASTYGSFIIDLQNYATTTQNKTVRSFSGADANAGGGEVALGSGLWLSTAAVTGIDLFSGSGDFTTGTTIALYGVN